MISVVAPLSLSLSSPLFLTSSVCLLEWLKIKIACRRRVGMRMPRCTLGISGMVQWTWSVSPVGQCVFVCVCVCVRKRQHREGGGKSECAGLLSSVLKNMCKGENNSKYNMSVHACMCVFLLVFLCLYPCNHKISWQGMRREMWEKSLKTKFPLLGNYFSARFRLWLSFLV